MRDKRHFASIAITLLAGVLVISVIGCFSSQEAVIRQPLSPIVWPQLPEQARIRFEYSFQSPEELGVKKGLLSWLAGDSKQNQLIQPVAVAVSDDETIYVVDVTGVLSSYQVATKKYRQQRSTKSGLLHTPVSLTLGKNDSVYLVDSESKKITVYTNKLHPVRELETGLDRPAGIVWDKWSNRLWIADAKGNRVVAFNLSGKVVAQIGDGLDSLTKLNTPTHLCIDSLGIYVTDAYNFQVKKYSFAGTLTQTFGKLGTNSGAFSRPKGIAIDSDSNLYVVDALFGNVQIFNPEGKLLLFFGTTGVTEPGNFNLPNGISIDHRNRIYVADTHHGMIQVFQYLAKQATTK
ncbi:MAG: hypothetical protein OEM52_00335 [bacterium]|nr:hypothetical protein [bacterium]